MPDPLQSHSSPSRVARGYAQVPRVAIIGLLLLIALCSRGWAALDYGRNWYGQDRLTLINFDEAGSCRAALDGFEYSAFVGWQTLALAKLAGLEPPAAVGDYGQVKAWCHSDGHLLIARMYSVLCGTGTVLVLWWLAVLLFRGRPVVAPLAAALLAVSGWHISESIAGTVDAASTFFIYLFFCLGVWAQRNGGWRWLLALLALLPAVATKYWIFVLLATGALLPASWYRLCLSGLSRQRGLLLLLAYAALFAVVSNPATPAAVRVFAPLCFYLLVPWRGLPVPGRFLMLALPWLSTVALQLDSFIAFSSGALEGRFGSDYGAIGGNKWLRNAVNLPVILVMGLGLPASLCALWGLAVLWQRPSFDRGWLIMLPLPAFALYMLFLAPVTYYRHYLPLLPALCLLAALGISALRVSYRKSLGVFVVVWQGLLALDLVSDYHLDPRQALPAWYAEHQPRNVLTSYYVSPPPRSGARHALLPGTLYDSRIEIPAEVDAVILSENWYDTAFANELNGPRVGDLQRLIKTTPEAAAFHRRVLAGDDPRFRITRHFEAPNFMPELLAHRWAYGSFTQFVGDIVILEPNR